MPPGFVRAVFLAFGRSCFPIKRIFINANFPILRAFDASAFSAGVVHTATNSRATPEHSRTDNTRRATAHSTIKVFLLFFLSGLALYVARNPSERIAPTFQALIFCPFFTSWTNTTILYFGGMVYDSTGHARKVFGCWHWISANGTQWHNNFVPARRLKATPRAIIQ